MEKSCPDALTTTIIFRCTPAERKALKDIIRGEPEENTSAYMRKLLRMDIQAHKSATVKAV